MGHGAQAEGNKPRGHKHHKHQATGHVQQAMNTGHVQLFDYSNYQTTTIVIMEASSFYSVGQRN